MANGEDLTPREARPERAPFNGGQRPVPDPTLLTTEALQRATADLKELIESKLDGMIQVREEEFRRVNQQLDLVERQRVEQKRDCVKASTPVLCADLMWRPAGSLCLGDELITCDDQPHTEKGKRTPRRFRRGIVTANSLEQDDLLRVTTSQGELVCNAHHPLLVNRRLGATKPRYRYWHWVRADSLQEGDLAMKVADVWWVDETWEGGWLAGILDGEGCLGFQSNNLARISITQRASDTLDRIEQALKNHGVPFSTQLKVRDAPQHSAIYSLQIDSRPQVMRLLGSIRPPRLMVNADRVWEGASIGARFRAAPVVSVEPVGRGTIAMLSVSTGTYIASGFAVHNTKDAVDAALSAQKEAVKEQTIASERSISKSETATNKQLEQLASTFQSEAGSLRRSIDELKERITDVDKKASAVVQQKIGAKDDRSGLYAGIGIIATVLVLGLTILGILIGVGGN